MVNVRRLLRNPLAVAAFILLFLFILVAILAPVIATPRPGRSPYMIPRDGYWLYPHSPSIEHPFGTTEGQYDIFYGVVWGTRTAFKIGLVVVWTSVLIGVVVGSLSAFYGGIVDEVLMRITDTFLSFPFLVAAMVLSMILGRGLENLMLALITFGWMGYARLTRSQVLIVKELAFVEAARAVGASDMRIILRHILPNSFYAILVQATMGTGIMALAASALSFLGVGTETGYADWGQMIFFAKNWIIATGPNPFKYWYTAIYPGMAIFLFVLAWTFLGDALRDILDPRLRHEE